MSPWIPGRDDVQAMIDEGRLTRLQGADAGVPALIGRADQELATATGLLVDDPQTAYIVGYDAAKHAAMALLAEQNLRTTAVRSHETLEHVLSAQFGGVFSEFGRLRRRRNELDYPASADDFTNQDEATKALGRAKDIVQSARRLLEEGVLTVF